MPLSAAERAQVTNAAAAWAKAQALPGVDDVPLKSMPALVAAVAEATALSEQQVREALWDAAGAAAEALSASARQIAGAYQGGAVSTPLVTDSGVKPMGVRLGAAVPGAGAAGTASGVKGLQAVELDFTVEHIHQTRVVITDEVNEGALRLVVDEARKLVKLLADRDLQAEGGQSTDQLDKEIHRIFQGLSSKAAEGKGVFLSREGADVALAAGSPGASAAHSTARRLAEGVAVGVDPASGDKVVLRPMGRVVHDLTLPQLCAFFDEGRRKKVAVEKLKADPGSLAALRTLSDAELDRGRMREASSTVEHVTLTGLAGDDTAFSFPTRWHKADGDLFSRRIIVDGPFRGILLDDLVGHLDERSLADGLADSRLKWLSPKQSGIAPVISTMDVEQGGEKVTKLRLRVPSTPEWTAARQSLRAVALKLEGVDMVKDSKNTLFVFTPQNLSFVRKVVQSFGISAEAQSLVEGHVAEQLRIERVTSAESIAKFSAEAIGGFKKAFIDREGKARRFDLSDVQKRAIARVVDDGFRGAVTLGMGMGKTLVALAAMKLLQDGGEKRPFLVVVPEGLEGGFHAEIFSKFEDDTARALADQVEVLSSKAFRKAQKDGTLDGKPFAADRYAAFVVDEAHLVSDRRTVAGAAVLAFQHPRTIELSGTPQPQPERMQTMDAGVQGVDLNAADARALRKQARDWRKFLFVEVNGIAVGVKGAFELKRGLKIDPTREMLEWIRTRFIYADSFDDDVELPKRNDVLVPLTMDKALEASYRAAGRPAKVALEGLVSIYRDQGVQVRDDGAPEMFVDKRGKERTRLSRQARDPRVHSIKSTLKPTIQELSKLTNTDEKVRVAGKKLMELLHEDELRGAPQSRALLFTDSIPYVHTSARALSLQMPGKLHAACLGNEIHLYRNGKKLERIGPFDLPFTQQEYRKDPTAPVDAEKNPAIPEEMWRTFVLNEVIGKHPEVATTTLYGPTYQAGQNLQWANVVCHLDRDTWSDFNMRQREARAHRRGQTRPVTVMHFDYVFKKQAGNLDLTLDQVRKLQAENDRKLLQQTLVAAQDIKLGEGFSPARDDRVFDDTARPSAKELALYAAGAEPTAATVGAAGGP